LTVEILSAWLNFWGADAIVEKDDCIEAFYTNKKYDQILKKLMGELNIPKSNIEIVEVEDKNWNEEWESKFKPLVIADLYVRAEFHERNKEGLQELIIAPKMAFGTGHHETTSMMLEYMQVLDFNNKVVLDYGCGTGILAVYASMKNAQHITAIDIQEEAIDNTKDHIKLNNQNKDSFELHVGDLDVLSSTQYDIILANINRHVLLNVNDKLANLMTENGKLIISGILERDRKKITKKYLDAGFELEHENQSGDWKLFVFNKV